MFDSKLILLLQRMPNKQFKELGLMVQSPYFNKNEDLIKFYEYLIEAHPDYEEHTVTYEAAHRFIFKGQPFEKKNIGYLMTDLVRLVERLLVLNGMEKDVGYQKLKLMEAYLDWDLDKAFNRVMKSAHKDVDKYPYQDGHFYHSRHRLYRLSNKYFGKLQKHESDQNLQLSVNELDMYYLTEKLRLSCEMLNRQVLVKVAYEYPFIQEILSFLKNNPLFLEDYPPLAIYMLVYEGFTNPDADVELFDKLLGLLNEHSTLFSRQEARGLYVQAINFCVRKSNSGKRYFVNKLFELYKSILNKDLIVEEGYVSPWTYMNIVTVGVRCGELEWTESFIEQYKSRLHPNFKDNAYNYNLAYLFFNKEEYAKAALQLNRVVFDDMYYSIESRALLLRIYYASEEFEPFYSLIDSFRIYLRRNKLITDPRKEMYLNLIKLINRLSKIRKGENQALDQLESQLNEIKLLVNREWVRDQINAKRK